MQSSCSIAAVVLCALFASSCSEDAASDDCSEGAPCAGQAATDSEANPIGAATASEPQGGAAATTTGGAPPATSSGGEAAPSPATGGSSPDATGGSPAADGMPAPGGTAPIADASTAADAGPTGSQSDASAGDRDDEPSEHCLQGAGDYSAAGPYEVTTSEIEIPSFGPYTLYRPATLETDCPHPIAAWGNGTGVVGPETYDHWNRHAASWGIVVVASHSDQPISMPYVDAGVDYLLAENDNPESELYQRLSQRAGTAGHSQGGRAATDAGYHPNVFAVISVQGGHTPSDSAAFICLTGQDDIALERCTLSYDEATGPAFLADHNDADHFVTPTILGAETSAGIEYVRVHTAWYRCHLAGDQAACDLFRGDPCPLCGEPGWARIEGKNLQ